MFLSNKPRVTVVGAGAIGCTLAARLAASGQGVNLLARGNAFEAIRSNGLRLYDLDGEHRIDVNVSEDSADFGEQDVIFLCTKATALTALMPALQPLLGPETLVVPLINGVPWWYFHAQDGLPAERAVRQTDPNGAVAAAIDAEQLLGCVVYMVAEVEAPGTVRSSNHHMLILGELDNRPSARLDWICSLLRKAGIEARATEKIRQEVWKKLIVNLTSNPLSVVAGATLGQIHGEPGLSTIVGKIFHETVQLAAAYNIELDFDGSMLTEFGTRFGTVRTSMLQDYEQGRPLELAAIGEAVLDLADHKGVAMPVTRDILALARFRGALAAA